MLSKTGVKISKKDLDKYLELAKKLAVEAGELLLKFDKNKNFKIKEKKGQGMASSADWMLEKFLISRIKKSFPSHNVLSEEQAYADKIMNYKDYEKDDALWILDPLDGTHNYLRGIDFYAISIAFVSKGVPLVGVVYRPVTDEFFFSIKGQGAYYSKKGSRAKKLGRKKEERTIKESLFALSFPRGNLHANNKELKFFKHLEDESLGIRRLGSTVLSICYVASGQFEGFYKTGVCPWDIAAAILICRESGVQVIHPHESEFNLFGKQLMVAPKRIIKNLQKCLSTL